MTYTQLMETYKQAMELSANLSDEYGIISLTAPVSNDDKVKHLRKGILRENPDCIIIMGRHILTPKMESEVIDELDLNFASKELQVIFQYKNPFSSWDSMRDHGKMSLSGNRITPDPAGDSYCTLGCICRIHNSVCALTAAHPFSSEQIGSPVYGFEKGNIKMIGHYAGIDHDYDIAWLELTDDVKFIIGQIPLPDNPTKHKPIRLGPRQMYFKMNQPVWKLGAVTGLTSGTIISQGHLRVGGKVNRQTIAIVDSESHKAPFAKKGDSGSLVFSYSGDQQSAIRPLGILTGTVVSKGYFLVSPLADFIQQYDVSFD